MTCLTMTRQNLAAKNSSDVMVHQANGSFFNMLWLFVCLVISCSFYSPIVCSQMTVLTSEQKRYAIMNTKITESSGLACSSRDKNLLWTHNDSGHMPIIYALDSNGRDLATFHLEDIESRDWEDMDAFEFQGKHYLLIADTGDNLKMSLTYRMSIIKEPIAEKNSRSAISPAWSFAFQYEDNNSYDVESVAVDVIREKIILLTKKTPHALMFELPLRPLDEEKIQIAVKTGEFKNIVNPSALDISADGKLMSINTYRRIHLFKRRANQTEELPRAGHEDNWRYVYSLSYKKLFQPEAMCLSIDKTHYYVSSERKPYLLKIRSKREP